MDTASNFVHNSFFRVLTRMFASVNHAFRFLLHWVLSINAKLPPRCSVEREKLIFFKGKNRKSKTRNQKKKKKNHTFGYNICYFVEGHIGYCPPLEKTSLFADWKCVVIGICQPSATLFNDFSSSGSTKTQVLGWHMNQPSYASNFCFPIPGL